MPKGGRLFKEGTYGSWIQDTIEQLFNQVAFIKKNKEDPAWQKKNEEFVPPADNVPYVHNDPSMMAAQTRASTLFTELYLMAGAMKHDNPKLHDPLPSPAYMDSIRSRAFEDGARQENLELFHFTKIDQTAKQFALDGKNPPNPRRMIDMLAQVYQVREEKKKEESVKEAEPEKEQAAVKQEAPVKESEGGIMPGTPEDLEGSIYERFIGFADLQLRDACDHSSSGYSNLSPDNPLHEKVIAQTKSCISMALAYSSIAVQHRKEKLTDDKEKELKELAKKRQQEIERRPDFKAVMDGASMKDLLDMVGNIGKERLNWNRGKYWEHVPFHEFTKRFDKQVETHRAELDAENKLRENSKNLVNELKGTTSKSFTGKLKSFFVGNSKEYDAAFRAIQGLSDGSVSKDQAREDIKKYLDLRADKVRDHQYGKDRFDAMLRGLSSVMEPEAFIDYCKGIDEARFDRSNGTYKGEIDAKAYMSDEAKQKLAENERKRAQARLRDEAVHRADSDSLKIAKDLKDDDLHSENERFIKYLRKVKTSDLDGSKSEQLRGYMLEHPGVREEARKIVEQRGMDIEVPMTAVDLMDDQTKEALENMQTGLQEEPKQVKQSKDPEMKV